MCRCGYTTTFTTLTNEVIKRRRPREQARTSAVIKTKRVASRHTHVTPLHNATQTTDSQEHSHPLWACACHSPRTRHRRCSSKSHRLWPHSADPGPSDIPRDQPGVAGHVCFVWTLQHACTHFTCMLLLTDYVRTCLWA
jgi:hypothetical protein